MIGGPQQPCHLTDRKAHQPSNSVAVRCKAQRRSSRASTSQNGGLYKHLRKLVLHQVELPKSIAQIETFRADGFAGLGAPFYTHYSRYVTKGAYRSSGSQL